MKNTKTKTYLLLTAATFLLFFSCSGPGLSPITDTYSISGTLTLDYNLPNGIQNYTVQLLKNGINYGVPFYPNTDGSYTIANVPAGTDYTIKVSHSAVAFYWSFEKFTVSGNITGKDYTIRPVDGEIKSLGHEGNKLILTTNFPFPFDSPNWYSIDRGQTAIQFEGETGAEDVETKFGFTSLTPTVDTNRRQYWYTYEIGIESITTSGSITIKVEVFPTGYNPPSMGQNQASVTVDP